VSIFQRVEHQHGAHGGETKQRQSGQLFIPSTAPAAASKASRSVGLVAFGLKFGKSLLGFRPQGCRRPRDFDFPHTLTMRYAPVKRRDKLAQMTLCDSTVSVCDFLLLGQVNPEPSRR
jgi:hypothetical protein